MSRFRLPCPHSVYQRHPKGTKVSIDVGTIVKKYEYDKDEVGYQLCESYQRDEEYSEDYQRKLDVCLGMVIEAISGQSEVIVEWVHMCRYHRKIGQITQEGVDPDCLYEVGQL